MTWIRTGIAAEITWRISHPGLGTFLENPFNHNSGVSSLHKLSSASASTSTKPSASYQAPSEELSKTQASTPLFQYISEVHPCLFLCLLLLLCFTYTHLCGTSDPH